MDDGGTMNREQESGEDPQIGPIAPPLWVLAATIIAGVVGFLSYGL